MALFIDSQAFLSPQNNILDFSPPEPSALALACVTSVPPSTTNVLLAHAQHALFAKTLFAHRSIRGYKKLGDLADSKHLYVLFGMQHAPKALELEHLRMFANSGISFMAVAYSDATEYGGGYKEPNMPLTARGKKLLAWMAEVGITPDISHAGHETARDILRFIRAEKLALAPVATHSGCFSVFNHPRNLPDDILKGIAQLGGYVGIPALAPLIALQGSDAFQRMNLHLRHATNVCGSGAVGIGSDCQHFAMTMVHARALYDYLVDLVKPDDAYFPDRPRELIEHGNRMFEVLHRNALAGFTRKECDRVLGENFLQYLARKFA